MQRSVTAGTNSTRTLDLDYRRPADRYQSDTAAEESRPGNTDHIGNQHLGQRQFLRRLDVLWQGQESTDAAILRAVLCRCRLRRSVGRGLWPRPVRAATAFRRSVRLVRSATCVMRVNVQRVVQSVRKNRPRRQ